MLLKLSCAFAARNHPNAAEGASYHKRNMPFASVVTMQKDRPHRDGLSVFLPIFSDA